MNSIIYLVILSLSAFLFSYIGTFCMRALLRSLIDEHDTSPTERDNHITPTPKGAGIALMLSLISFCVVGGIDMTIIGALIILTIISIIDDIRPLSPGVRLVAHITAASLLVSTIDGLLLPEIIPEIVQFAILVMAVVWFMNLYNFMDGIDEITAMQSVSIGAAITVLGVVQPELSQAFTYDSVVMASAVIGFWLFNQHPASIFMGDSGSVPLGAFIGWLLLSLASAGYGIVAMMLPAYYIVDATFTLTKRVLSGHKPWDAHSSHAYQHAVRTGRSHSSVVYNIATFNIIVIGAMTCAVLLPEYSLYCLIAVYAVAVILYFRFLNMRPLPAMIDVTPQHQHATT